MTRTSLSWPSAGVGDGFRPRATSSVLALLLNTIDFPSGDQSGPPAPRVNDVNCHESPPAIESIKSCGESGRPSFSVTRTNARYLPSGDQRGVVSRVPLVRRCGSSVPVVETDQMEVS